MKTSFLALTALVLAPFPALQATETSASRKPNIILILADDLGIGNVSAYGADHFKNAAALCHGSE